MNWNMIQWYCDHQLQRLKIIQCIEKENVDKQVEEEAGNEYADDSQSGDETVLT